MVRDEMVATCSLEWLESAMDTRRRRSPSGVGSSFVVVGVRRQAITNFTARDSK
jgi:hypothetical protein